MKAESAEDKIMGTATDTLLVALDIGSSKLTLLVAERAPDGTLIYLDGLPAPVSGMRSGIVVNMADVTAAVKETVYEVEERCGRRITSACVSVSGAHLQGQSIHSSITITPLGREISDEDLTRAIGAARAELHLSTNREILHEIPRAYRVDGQGGVIDPRGMMGYQLEADVHYVTGASTTIANLLKCIGAAGIEPTMLVAAPLAASEAVRSAYDSERSFAVLEIGAETTNLVLYADGFVWTSKVLAFGGAEITQALAAELRLPQHVAEDIKLHYVYVGSEAVNEFELVELPPSAGIEALLPRSEVIRISATRAQRLVELLAPELAAAQRAGLTPEALILTGGGASLPGLDDFLSLKLDMPTYPGIPSGIKGLPATLERPAYAAPVGLMLWSANYAAFGGGKNRQHTVRTMLPQMAAGVKRIVRFVLP